jgi:hypothetical protein
MDPCSSPHSCIAEAKKHETFRALITCLPSSFEMEHNVVSIDECWLEQIVLEDFLSPRENTDGFYICFTWKSSLQNNALPYLYPKMAYPCDTSFISMHDSGSVYAFIMRREELHPTNLS